MRKVFGKLMVDLAKKDKSIVLLTGDVEHEMDLFKKKISKKIF